MDGVSQFVNAFFNDPGDVDLPFERSWPSDSITHFQIPDWSNQAGDFQPGTPEFEAGHLGVILSHTYDAWAGYFGAPFDWQPGKLLSIEPRAGQDMNAYYDRQGLRFYYDTDAKSNRTVYACESCDVVAHECGHAVLDAHRPDYWDSLHPETAAFHEAFGDISALLTTLQFPSVRASLLKETGGDLSKTSGISQLAEQFAAAMYGQDPNACAPDALRNLVNPFRYKATGSLPGRAPYNKLSSESHNFSRVVSGAFYDILAGIFTLLRQENAALPEDDALAQARDQAGQLLAKALLLAPPGDATYRLIAGALVQADRQFGNGKYFSVLRRVLVARRILTAKQIDALTPRTGQARGKTRVGRADLLSLAPQAAPPEALAKAAPLRREGLVVARDLGERGGVHTIQYHAQRAVRLKGKQFGAADGALIPLRSGLTLNVDAMGMVASAHPSPGGAEGARAVRDHVQKLAQRDRISDHKPADRDELTHLITRRQPYYVDYDALGNKVIRRAFIACEVARRGLAP